MVVRGNCVHVSAAALCSACSHKAQGSGCLDSNVPNQLFATCLWSIVWPVAIANMFGYANKAVALSLADTVNVFVGFANPFVGSLSDRLPERYARRWGRRRPFVFIGTATSGFGVWMTYYAVSLITPIDLRGPCR